VNRVCVGRVYEQQQQQQQPTGSWWACNSVSQPQQCGPQTQHVHRYIWEPGGSRTGCSWAAVVPGGSATPGKHQGVYAGCAVLCRRPYRFLRQALEPCSSPAMCDLKVFALARKRPLAAAGPGSASAPLAAVDLAGQFCRQDLPAIGAMYAHILCTVSPGAQQRAAVPSPVAAG
jgi:hypothetical protein